MRNTSVRSASVGIQWAATFGGRLLRQYPFVQEVMMKRFVRFQPRHRPLAVGCARSFLTTVGLALLLLAARAESASPNQQARKAAADAAATFQELPFAAPVAEGSLADRANKAADPAAFAVTMNRGQAIMACKLQALEATVHGRGLKIRSTSTSEGAGEFSLGLASVGRAGEMSDVSAEGGTVSADSGRVRLARSRVTEEFTTSADGIRQDFLIPVRPAGDGPLMLDVALAGATVSGSGAKLPIDLPSGRKLVYARLQVTDASGVVLPAEMAALSPGTIRIAVDDTDAVYPLRIDPTISDADWFAVNLEIPGTDNSVAAVVYHSGTLYLGGGFTVAGDVLAACIAKWDGSTWSTLGSGMNGNVNVLAFDSSGNLYAGGYFTTAGGVSANRIAKWDGSAWSALGSGVNGAVYALAFDSSANLYAGGYFTTAGGASRSYIAKWNGSTWSALGSGMNTWVYALACDTSGNVYAGGAFTTAGGVSASYIAKWNGSTWSALGSGMNSTVKALAFDSSGNLYAGGTFTTAGGVSANRIAKWNGSTWSALGSGTNGSVYALAFDSAGNLYAGGDFTNAGGVSANLIAKWNGSTWSALGSGMNSNVYALAFDSSGNLYAGGNFSTAGGLSAFCIAKWDGSAWSALGSGMNSTVSALAFDSGGNLYAGGSFTTTSGGSANCIAKWDGSVWSALGSGVNSLVGALAVNSTGDLYAGGWFTVAGSVSANRIAKWDGSAWSALGSGLGSGAMVRALAVGPTGDLCAGGTFTTAGGVSANYIANWNGSTWSALGSGMNTNGTVYALAFDSSGDLYAGGAFTSAGGVSANYIAKWNGSTWSALGSGMSASSIVYALAFDSAGTLYAGGSFTTAGGVSASKIARWDGSSWSALGSGTNGTVNALAFDSSGNLYAGGYFTTAGGVSTRNIAKWNGSNWSALGSGVTLSISALAFDSAGNLYTGGQFMIAGNLLSPYVAMCALPYRIGGTVSGPTNAGVSMVLTGAASRADTTIADGTYSLAGLDDGNYVITPSKTGCVFSPTSRNVTVSGGNVTGMDFTLTRPPVITESDPQSVTCDPNNTPTAFALTLHATDADGDTITWSIGTAAAHGTASASGTGTSKAIGYTPTTDWYGADSFTVEVDDGNGGTDTITVNVTVSHPDRDHDGLLNTEEATLGTDPDNADSDGDGLADAWEVELGLDPLVADADVIMQEWVATYDGPDEGPDRAQAMVFDAATGHIYVTGDSKNPGETTSDIATVAYDTRGQQLWVARYGNTTYPVNHVLGVAVNSDTGDVYVTGDSTNAAGTLTEMVTLAYDAAGTSLWAARFAVSGNPHNLARAVTVDPDSGTVFVTGHSADSAWQETDIVSVAYDPADGTELWTASYGGTSYPSNQATALAWDPVNENLYVAGYSWNSGLTQQDMLVLAYDADGTELWSGRYGSTQSPASSAVAVAVAPTTGNVYVIGSSGPANGTASDIVTRAYSPAGSLVWTATYADLVYLKSAPTQLAVNPTTGDVFIAGDSYTADSSASVMVALGYSSSGTPLWNALYAVAGHPLNSGFALVVDPSAGDVFLTGTSADANGFAHHLTAAYNSDGVPLWTQSHDGQNGGDAEGMSIAVAASGSVIVAGYAQAASDDFCTIRYSVDTDKDGLPDAWEMAQFSDLTHGAAEDGDEDGLTNLQEYQAGTSPHSSDTDSDGMPDAWEVANGLNGALNDATADLDGDGADNLTEYLEGRDPTKGAVPDTTGLVELKVFTVLE